MNYYVNEHTFLAYAGHLFIVVSFVSALLALVGYSFSGSDKLSALSWRRYSRVIFGVHTVSAFAAIGILFFVIANHYFEFHYVWKYSNLAMEAKYIFSCFWSGQEGSFLLWAFWIIVLAWLFISLNRSWEGLVMPFVSGTLAFIFSMLLGVYVFDLRIGNNPFILIRELPENVIMPWAQMSDYLSRITAFQDGVGLNPLLQNYWMTIHPPVLFLGFAATLFPFAIAAGALWRKELATWTKPALPWTVFGMMTLGAGILLGGAWAYEALSFGGFWAWDPVENASLVPWLMLVAAAHSIMITSKRKTGLFISLLLALMPFIVVVYSSFLTRSGILGDASVHSFTENGLFVHLLLFVLISIWLAVCLLLQKKKSQLVFTGISLICLGAYAFSGNIDITLTAWLLSVIAFLIVGAEKSFPKVKDDSSLASRDFWMFAGGLVLIVSSIQITVTTSIPVINKIFDTSIDAFTDLGKRNHFYNTWQVPFAILLTLMLAVGQFLKYRKSNLALFVRQLRISAIIAVVLTVVFVILLKYNSINQFLYVLLLFSAIFAVVSNATYWSTILKGKWNFAGGTIAHIGFGLLVIGALVSSSGKTEISKNFSSFDLQQLNETFRNNENILLRQGDTLLMDRFFVTYRGKAKQGGKLYYDIGYFSPVWDGAKHAYKPGDSLFSLHPMVQINEKFGNVAEPGTRHFFTYDVFTHVKWADMESFAIEEGETGDGFMGETLMKVTLGETYDMENFKIHFHDIYILNDTVEKARYTLKPEDLAVKAIFKIKDVEKVNADTIVVEPLFVVRDSVNVMRYDTYSKSLDAKFRIAELSREPNTIALGIRQREYLVMQAVMFPGMNILWAGCIIMVLGCFLAARNRWKGKRSISPKQINETVEDVVV